MISIETTLKKYGQLTASQLVELTHKESTPWTMTPKSTWISYSEIKPEMINLNFNMEVFRVTTAVTYLPTGFSQVDVTDLDNGLTIQDSMGNQRGGGYYGNGSNYPASDCYDATTGCSYTIVFRVVFY